MQPEVAVVERYYWHRCIIGNNKSISGLKTTFFALRYTNAFRSASYTCEDTRDMLNQNFTRKNLGNRLDNINVMVVDGKSKTGNLIKCILNRLGFRNVFIASDASSGVNLIRDKKIDLVFANWDLYVLSKPVANDAGAKPDPEILPLSGAKFVERLRASPSSPNPFLPVVMFLPLDGTSAELTLARDAGVNEILMKPFTVESLCKKIASIVEEPRIFINSGPYKGPCRRIANTPVPGKMERRVREIRFLQPPPPRRGGSLGH